jgi:hypothetical protein
MNTVAAQIHATARGSAARDVLPGAELAIPRISEELSGKLMTKVLAIRKAFFDAYLGPVMT